MINATITESARLSQVEKPNKRQPNLIRWHALIAEIRNPDLELTPDVFAAIWREYSRLKNLGHQHDPMLTALLLMLQRQVLLTEDGIGDFATSGRAVA